MNTSHLEGSSKPVRTGTRKERQESNEDGKRHFRMLLEQEEPAVAMPPWQGSALSDVLTTELEACRGALSRTAAAQQAQFQHKPTQSLDLGRDLHLRLFNGQLPGVELHVSLAVGALTLRLSTIDKRHHDKLSSKRESLEAMLAELLNCPVDLKVFHAET